MKIRELSATGGGAAPGTGATANVGDGEGMASKYAFGGAGGTKAKRKKGLVVKRNLQESPYSDIDSMDIKKLSDDLLNGKFNSDKEKKKYAIQVLRQLNADKNKPASTDKEPDLEENKLYKISFNTKSASGVQSVPVIIYRKLNKADIKKLEGFTRTQTGGAKWQAFNIQAPEDYADEGTSDIYDINREGYRNTKWQKIYNWAILSKSDLSKIEQLKSSKKISDEEFSIAPMSMDRMIKFATVGTEGVYRTLNSIIGNTDNTIISKILQHKTKVALRDKEKETKKNRFQKEPGAKKVFITAGPGAGQNAPVEMTDDKIKTWRDKYGADSIRYANTDKVANTGGKKTYMYYSVDPKTKKSKGFMNRDDAMHHIKDNPGNVLVNSTKTGKNIKKKLKKKSMAAQKPADEPKIDKKPYEIAGFSSPNYLAKEVIKSHPELKKMADKDINAKVQDMALQVLSKSGMNQDDIYKLLGTNDYGKKFIVAVHSLLDSGMREGKTNLFIDMLREMFTEEKAVVQQLPAGDDPLSKAKKAVTLLVNRFFGMTFEECVDNPELLRKLNSDAENVVKWIGKEEDKVFDANEKMADALSNESSTIVAMQNVLSDLMSAFEDANKSSFNINYKR